MYTWDEWVGIAKFKTFVKRAEKQNASKADKTQLELLINAWRRGECPYEVLAFKQAMVRK